MLNLLIAVSLWTLPASIICGGLSLIGMGGPESVFLSICATLAIANRKGIATSHPRKEQP
jgi:hypothetical protein